MKTVGLHFATDSMGIFCSFKLFLVGSIKRIFSARVHIGLSRSSKVIILIGIESAYVTSY